MSRSLAEYLGISSPSFIHQIASLEKSAGEPAEDIKLSNEISLQTKSKVKALGLDPNDTTLEELYASLKQIFLRDNTVLESSIIELEGEQSIHKSISKNLNQIISNKNCFSLKNSVVKNQLRINPPMKLLRKLGYTSIESILKKEPTPIILALALAVEDEKWKENYYNLYISLRPSDFEEKKIQIFEPKSSKRWQALSQEIAKSQSTTVISTKELGSIILLPINEQIKGLTLASLIFALDSINQISISSVFSKINQVKDNFGQVIAAAFRGKTDSLALIAEQDVPWHLIHKFYSKFKDKFPFHIFEPHVQKENFNLINIEEVLSTIHPCFEFWFGTEYLAYKDQMQAVSLNIKDVAINAVNNLDYSEASNAYFKDGLWTELMLRYISQSHLEQSILEQLDNKLLIDYPNDFNFELMPAS